MKDDKQFINGMIVGSILFAFTIASAILYAIRPSTAASGLPLPRSFVRNQSTSSIASRLPAAQAQSDLGVGQIVQIAGEAYRVAAASEHPDQDLVFRLLAPTDTIAPIDCINNVAKKALFTIWAKDGQQLRQSDAATPQSLSKGAECVRIAGWQGSENLVLSKTAASGLNGGMAVSFYNVNTLELRTAYEYQVVSPDEKTIDHIWSHGEDHLYQRISLPSNDATSLYRSAHPQDLVALTVTAEAKVDLISEDNLNGYETGLIFVVDGEQHFIPWKAN